MNDEYKPSVRLVSYLPEAPKIIAVASKLTISHKPVDRIKQKITEEEVRKWIRELILHGHGSPLEHSIYIFEITCSRVTSHQIVRHRIASYTQLSQRYSDKYLRQMISAITGSMSQAAYNGGSRVKFHQYSIVLRDFTDSTNDWNELLDIVSKAFIIPPKIISGQDTGFLKNLLNAVSTYYELLAHGVPYEDARYVLPQSIKTRIIMTMNARELIESFLPLRMCSRAQWEIRYIAWSMWRILNTVHPEIFVYAGPRCVYYDQRSRKELCPLKKYLSNECVPSIERCPEKVEREQINMCIIYGSRDPWSL